MHLQNFQKPETTNTGADVFLDPRAFCRMRFSPLVATGVIVGLLREHFGNPNAIVDPMLQNYVWRTDTSTGIVIESSSNDVLTNIGQRPAVLVRRNPVQMPQRHTFGNEIMQLGGQTGEKYWVVLHGSHTLFSIATKPAAAESLANEVAIFLLQFSPLISASLCFGRFEFQEIGVLSKLEGSGGQYVVPTTFSYVTEFSWMLDEDLPPIRHINLKVLYGLD